MTGMYGSRGVGNGVASVGNGVASVGDDAASVGEGVTDGVGLVSIGDGFSIGDEVSTSGKPTGAQAMSSISKVVINTVNCFFI